MEYSYGPIAIKSLDLAISFEHIYRTTTVKTILRSVAHAETEIIIE